MSEGVNTLFVCLRGQLGVATVLQNTLPQAGAHGHDFKQTNASPIAFVTL